jgi:hypothetical protein
MSARAGLAAARAAGVHIRDSTWFRVVGEVRRGLANQIDEMSKPLNRRPLGPEISILPTKIAKGWVQYADVFVQDQATGAVSRRFYAVRGTSLLTRQAIINRALNAYAAGAVDDPSKYPEKILGAAYSATYQMTPGFAAPPTPQVAPAPAPVAPAPSRMVARSRRFPGSDMIDDLATRWDSVFQEAMDDADTFKHGDSVINVLIAKQPGWGAPAEVVSPAALDAAVAQGWTQLWRGVMSAYGKDAAEIAETVRTGPWRVGYGIYGQGMYVSPRRTTAEFYREAEPASGMGAPQWGPAPLHEWTGEFERGYRGGLLRMALDPRARVIEYHDLGDEHRRWLGANLGKVSDRFWANVQNDISRFAVMRGYDVIHVQARDGINDGSDYPPGIAFHSEADQYIILNRSVVKMEGATDRYDT